jgi:hypothetical protein
MKDIPVVPEMKHQERNYNNYGGNGMYGDEDDY